MNDWIEKDGYDTCLLASADDLNTKATEVQLFRFRKGKFDHYHKAKTEFFYFTAGDGMTDSYRLWKSDGTSNGTTMVKDISTSFTPGSPHYLTVMNGVLYFDANNGVNGTELWKSDGTSVGTVMVKDINPGSGSSAPGMLTYLNGLLYFEANDGVHGIELWQSDGTSTGTVIVKDIAPGNQSSLPHALFSFKNKLYFVATDDNDIDKLWESDGTSNGTNLVYTGDLVVSSEPKFTAINDDLFFIGSIGNSGFELLKYNSLATGENIERVSEQGILNYPNPTSDFITFKYDSKGSPATFYLFHQTGQKILEKEMTPEIFQLNLKGLRPGIFIYEIKSGRNCHRGKIILR